MRLKTHSPVLVPGMQQRVNTDFSGYVEIDDLQLFKYYFQQYKYFLTLFSVSAFMQHEV